MKGSAIAPPCNMPSPPAPTKQPSERINVKVHVDKISNKKEIDKRVRLLTKDMFILERTIDNKMRMSKEHMNDTWERLAKGYNFVVQTEDGNIYSIPYINNMLTKDIEED